MNFRINDRVRYSPLPHAKGTVTGVGGINDGLVFVVWDQNDKPHYLPNSGFYYPTGLERIDAVERLADIAP